ncbi:hypothetical protein AVEN_140954-1 [Araneus ventricosus]|uniref:Uncharacterized protein n=1 Tax=Araneus ventricosus TaxID=182803 RepID=A0A4Y2GB55_ARAVE|nr:hypothetical protein AVEN_140954-1 [Araneus ventricosus]
MRESETSLYVKGINWTFTNAPCRVNSAASCQNQSSLRKSDENRHSAASCSESRGRFSLVLVCSAPCCTILKTVMFISRYPPPDIANSFCLVVKMLDSGSKGPRL